MTKPNQKEKKDRPYLMPLLLLLLSGFFVFLFLLPVDTQGPRQRSAEAAQKFEKKVNKHLFQTSQQMALAREKAQLEAARLQHQGIRANPGFDPEKLPHEFDISHDTRNETLVRELGRDVKPPALPSNPQDLIQAELFEAQQMAAYTEEYKKEYASQFVENAKKAGYNVKLNDQFKVISVQPLRRPSDQYNLFEAKDAGFR